MIEMLANLTNSRHTLDVYPTMTEYYTRLSPLLTLVMFVAVQLLLLNICIYCTTVAKLRKRLHKPLLQPTCLLCSLYVVISLAAMVTIAVPKAWLACHTIMHISFTVGAVIFHRLCFLYVESETNYMKETDGAAITINTAPCCCCCVFLPAVIPSKTKFNMLRYMVWQMPFVQCSIMLVVNGIYYREQELYMDVMLYFIPFLLGSILIGIWALNITVRMIHKLQDDLRLMRKMFCLQLILLLCKLQYMLLDTLLKNVDLGLYPVHDTVHRQTFINFLILAEMVLVSLLAQNAYQIPIQIPQK